MPNPRTTSRELGPTGDNQTDNSQASCDHIKTEVTDDPNQSISNVCNDNSILYTRIQSPKSAINGNVRKRREHKDSIRKDPADTDVKLEQDTESKAGDGKEEETASHSEFEKINKWQCKICFKFYCSPNSLKYHIKFVHNGERNHPCKVCRLSFTKPSDLIRHNATQKHIRLSKDRVQAAHVHKKDHHCMLCTTAFSSRAELVRHKHSQRHKNLANGKGMNGGNLKNSVKTVSVPQRNHRCESCNSDFERLHDLKRHKKSQQHMKMKDIGHNLTLKHRNAVNGDLKNHLKTVDVCQKEHHCMLCDAAYSKKADLLRHKHYHKVKSLENGTAINAGDLKNDIKTVTDKSHCGESCNLDFSGPAHLILSQKHKSKTNGKSSGDNQKNLVETMQEYQRKKLCELCKLAFSSPRHLARHKSTQKHLSKMKIIGAVYLENCVKTERGRPKNFHCDFCNLEFRYASDFTRHKLTKNHQNRAKFQVDLGYRQVEKNKL